MSVCRSGTILVLLLPFLLAPVPAAGDEEHEERGFFPEGAVGYAPIGVRDARVIPKGHFELGYRFQYEDYGGNRDGIDRVGEEAVRAAGFPDVTYRMFWSEHRLTALYAPFERLTLSASLPYLFTEMKHHAADGSVYKTRGSGVGDFEFALLIPFMEYRRQSIVLDLGMSFPTGDIDVKDDRPTGDFRLPYQQRLGSGTYDLVPSVTYKGFARRFGWGVQLAGTYRINKNHRDYKLGNVFEATTWGKIEIVRWLAASVRVSYTGTGNLSGEDDGLPGNLQTEDPNLQAGSQVDLSPGIDFAFPFLGSQRLGVEADFPVFQDLDGPQLDRGFRLTAGWQWTF